MRLLKEITVPEDFCQLHMIIILLIIGYEKIVLVKILRNIKYIIVTLEHITQFVLKVC